MRVITAVGLPVSRQTIQSSPQQRVNYAKSTFLPLQSEDQLGGVEPNHGPLATW